MPLGCCAIGTALPAPSKQRVAQGLPLLAFSGSVPEREDTRRGYLCSPARINDLDSLNPSRPLLLTTPYFPIWRWRWPWRYPRARSLLPRYAALGHTIFCALRTHQEAPFPRSCMEIPWMGSYAPRKMHSARLIRSTRTRGSRHTRGHMLLVCARKMLLLLRCGHRTHHCQC